MCKPENKIISLLHFLKFFNLSAFKVKYHLQMKSLKEFHLKNRKKSFDLIELQGLLVVFSAVKIFANLTPHL